MTATAAPVTTNLCPSCGRDFGPELACQFCDQVSGMPSGVVLSSSGRRIGGYLLESVLLMVTLGIGWLIWTWIIAGQGQTPAKKLLGMRVVKLRTGKAASWGEMFVREVFSKWIGSIVSMLTLGILMLMPFWDRKRQAIWDKVSSTVVVDDAAGATLR